MLWGHNSKKLVEPKLRPYESRTLLFLAMFVATALLSGCSLLADNPSQDDQPSVSAEEIVTDEPAANYGPPEDSAPASSNIGEPTYTEDELRIIYYGEVLAYRYGVEVPGEEWLQVLTKACDSYSSTDSTIIYGPAAADTLESDPREAFLLESFVFLVGGSFMCGSGTDISHLDRYGDDATLIYLAFTSTANNYAGLDIDAIDFEFSYDLELAANRAEYAAPPFPPDYEQPPGDDDHSSDYYEEPPDATYPGPGLEYEGNSGGPSFCNDGTISQSSGSGTCSWHGGER